jgi:hypothetical protein
MAGLTLRETNLNDLRNKAIALTSNAVSLANVFAEEATRLNRMAMASQLMALRSSIVQQLQMAKAAEDAARGGHNQASIVTSVGRLASGIIKMASQDDISAFGDQLLKKPVGRQRPFGGVLVCIGPTGVPDGVGVVSVSQLARGSNREEAAVTNELQERGHLLFSEKTFCLLIDKLIEDVLGGRLLLPISPEKLPQLKYTVAYRPDGKVAECLPLWSSFDEAGQVSP